MGLTECGNKQQRMRSC